MPSLQDQVILITGASSGFGEAIARACAREGARLALVARSAERLEQLARELGSPERVLAAPADVTSDTAVASMVATVIAHFGHIDVLVNNAGFGIMEPTEQAKIADLQDMMNVNCYGAMRCTLAVLPHMHARHRGQIVTMASIAGLIPFRNMAFYGGSKSAIVGMFETLTIELTGSGVRNAIICPGVARTTFFLKADAKQFPRITRMIPWMTADQIAETTLAVMKRRKQGIVVVPGYMTPIILLGRALPGLNRLAQRIIR